MRHRLSFLAVALATLTLATVTLANAQGGSLSAKLETLGTLLPTEVQAGKDFVEQELALDPDKPYVITVTQTEGAGKRTDVASARVNLALLRRVRVASGRGDRLPVGLYAAADNIAVADEDGDVDYESEFELLAEDTDNARALVALFEEILPLARTAYEAAVGLPSDAAGLRDFIVARVRDVEAGRDSYTQTLAFDPADGTGTLELGGGGNRDRETAYRFIVADLQGRTIEIEPRGGAVEVTLPSRNGREYVEVREEGELDFDDEVVLRFADYDDAQVVQEAFKALVELAGAARDAKGGGPTTASAATAALVAALANAEVPEMAQALAGECAAALTVSESGRSSEERRYDFDFADVDARNVEVKPGRGAIAVELSVKGGEDYVRVTEDGEPDGYDDEVVLRFTSSTDAYAALQAVEYLAANCPDPVESAPLTGADLVAAANVERFPGSEDEQTLELEEGKDCNYVLVRTERSGSKAEETESRFSLRDLDARRGELDVRGDEVSVTFGTRRDERVIDVLEGDGDQAFEDEVEIFLADALTGRRFLAGMKAAIEACD